MTVEADEATAALCAVWEHLLVAVPGAWARRQSGVMGALSGIALPTMNGVWPAPGEPEENTVATLLDEVASSGMPYCLQARPAFSARVQALATRRAMRMDGQIPLMILDRGDRLDHAQDVEDLAIRQLEPDEAVTHAVTAARGFEAPEGPFLQLMTPDVLQRPGTRCYVGEVGGDPVTTGLGVTLGQFVGIFNIATPPEHRGRGFGAAVTARAVSDGLAHGAKRSFLQSSDAGYDVYRRLGFITLERWDCWVTSS